MGEPETPDRVGAATARPSIAWSPRLSIESSDAHRWLTWSALVAAAGALVLAVFGIPPLDLHGPLHRLGIMDPLCGGTRSWYLLIHGQLRDALRYNPAGPLLMATAAAVLIRAVVGAATGRWVSFIVDRRVYVPVLVVAVVALEVNQQLNAALLIDRWGG